MYSHQEPQDSFSFHATSSPSVKTETYPEGLKRERENKYMNPEQHMEFGRVGQLQAFFVYVCVFVIEGPNLIGRVCCPRLKELNPSVIFLDA